MKKFLIIDANALVHRTFHALPKLSSPSGAEVQGAYGFCLVFLKALKEINPDYICACFDLPGPTFRHEVFKEYKAKRKKPPKELYEQIPIVKKILNAFGIKILEKQGYEADDLIGSLVYKFKDKKDLEIIILTGDLDTLQLVDKNIKIFTFRKGLTDIVIYDIDKVKQRFEGLVPSQLPDFKGLAGDLSDNIPGVKGIGQKTAIKLILTFKNLENLFEVLKKDKEKFLKESSLKEKYINILKQSEEIAFFSKELSKIRKNIKLPFNLENFKLKEFDKEKIKKLFYEYGFLSLINRLDSGYKKRQLSYEYKNKIESFSFEKLDKNNLFIKKENSYYLVFLQDKKVLKIEKDKNVLKKIFENPALKLEAYDFKDIYKSLLEEFKLDIENIDFDFKLAMYLLNPGVKNYPIESLFYKYNTKDLFKIKNYLEKELKKMDLFSLFKNIELKLIKPISYMEYFGIKIDKIYLENFLSKIKEKIKILTEKIEKEAGISLNLNSPKQVSWLLFEKLNLPTQDIKKTKEGNFSTSTQELLKLKDKFPIVSYILEYRELDKLFNTYLKPFLNFISEKDKRIHPKFSQTTTATGRLSCENPNLQAIPQKSEIQKNFRRIFISEKDWILLSFDYSQIELRIIAHLADEELMIEYFKNKKDIHKLTASLLFDKNYDDISEKQRSIAKTINFGIIYGMSPYGLKSALNIDYNLAKKFIDDFFEKYKGIKKYIDKTIKDAQKYGYLRSIMKRIRYVKEINSQNEVLRNQAKRIAINFPVQGSSADIIKKAMVEIFELIEEKFKDSCRMILQIHDELIFEIKKDKIEEFSRYTKDIMENVVKLKVPLEVDIKYGKNLRDLKPFIFKNKTLF